MYNSKYLKLYYKKKSLFHIPIMFNNSLKCLTILLKSIDILNALQYMI